MEPRLGKEGYTRVSPFGDDFNFQDLFDGGKQGFFICFQTNIRGMDEPCSRKWAFGEPYSSSRSTELTF